jgi:anti-sigma B factor antagonist
MNLKVQKTDSGAVVLHIEGDVDMSTSPEVRKALAPLFKKGVRKIIVDLTRVPYMDSSGIATLIEGLQRSRQLQIPLILAGMTSPVEAAFELAHLKEVFVVVPRVEDALEGGVEQ